MGKCTPRNYGHHFFIMHKLKKHFPPHFSTLFHLFVHINLLAIDGEGKRDNER
jgi:hypothetical protein